MTGNRDGWWLGAVVSPLVLLAGWMLWPDSPEATPTWVSTTDNGRPEQTIATRWQEPGAAMDPAREIDPPQEPTSEDEPEPTRPRISLDRLQNALANIGVDADGSLVLDEIALVSLRQAFRALEDADPATLGELKLYVEAGLEGETGAHAARIVGDYINYRRALKSASAGWAEQESLSPREKLDLTIALRRQHMDPLAASQLFAGEDAHQRYLIAREEVRSDDALSAVQKQDALARLQEDLHSGALLVDSEGTDAVANLRSERQHWESMGLSGKTRDYLQQQTLGLVAARDLTGTDSQDWQTRFNQFTRQRDTILGAGLTEEEKASQVSDLMETYFSDEEVQAARNWLPDYLKTELSN